MVADNLNAEDTQDETDFILLMLILYAMSMDVAVAAGASLLSNGAYDIEKIANMTDAELYRYIDTLKGVSQTTRTQIADAIAESNGDTTILEEKLNTILGDGRVNMLAITTTTAAFSAGRTIAFSNSGLDPVMIWQTSEDDRVCEECGAHEGEIITDEEPPLHPGCRCEIVPKE